MERTRRGNHSEAADSLAPVVGRVAASAHGAVDKAVDMVSAAAKIAEKKGSQMRDLQKRYVDDCRERVREKPLSALGVALAAGFVLSFLLNRR